jgi:hypothetical protein
MLKSAPKKTRKSRKEEIKSKKYKKHSQHLTPFIPHTENIQKNIRENLCSSAVRKNETINRVDYNRIHGDGGHLAGGLHLTLRLPILSF